MWGWRAATAAPCCSSGGGPLPNPLVQAPLPLRSCSVNSAQLPMPVEFGFRFEWLPRRCHCPLHLHIARDRSRRSPTDLQANL